ncbi:MAG: hypothetical protein QOD42_3536 [Sphingomonadales bacterium]|jgi:hypothetical protein|nr:hypothetical protein [Sphingomonadales bacterium]
MSVHNHRQFDRALDRIDQAILPSLSRLLDSLLDSAALARPGIDAEEHAAGLRRTARQMGELTFLVGAAAQRPNIRA